MKIRIKLIYVLAFSVLLSFSNLNAEKPLSETAEKLRTHVKYLASDELEGRLAGSPGNIKAAEYILNYFKTIGLKPVNQLYRHDFQVRSGIKLSPKNSVSFTKLIEKPGLPIEMWTKAEKKWTTGVEWQPISFSENSTVNGEVAFVGYGISAKEINYDDYAGIDVKGKIVIVLSDSADGKPVESRFENYSTLRYKESNARDHGAIGVIFVKRISDSSNVFYPLKVERTIKNGGLVVVQATRTEIAKFFPKEKNLYPTELEMRKSKAPNSFVLPNTKVTLTVDIDFQYSDAPNIFGLVQGTDPSKSNEYIVVGAHFDHLGWGLDNSNYKGKPAIHNGADDNASGTSALMELAAEISKKPLRRNIIFVAFNGEEMGTLGSSYFVKNSPIPTEQITFMLNLDMIGRMKDNKLNIFGTGTSAKFDKLIDSLGILDTLQTLKNSEGYGPSDHSSFYAKGIPILFFFTGAHADYHSPTDDWDKLNYESMVKVMKFSHDVLNTIDADNEKPNYIKTGTDPMKANENAGGPPKGYGGVWFGAIPGFEENKTGLLINGCSGGSPCEKAGLKANDIIIKLGEKDVKNLYDLSFVLKQLKVGDKIEVLYVRDGKQHKTEATLQKR